MLENIKIGSRLFRADSHCLYSFDPFPPFITKSVEFLRVSFLKLHKLFVNFGGFFMAVKEP